MSPSIEPLAKCAPWSVLRCGRVGSTMDVAKDHLAEARPESPFVIVAEEQVAGRGRQGRSWFSPTGSLAATFVMTAPIAPASLSGFSLVVGCALQESCTALGAAVALKWPNDVISLDRRKLSGVLIELVIRDSSTIVLVGVGMNIEAAPKNVPACVSLRELTGTEVSCQEVLESLAGALWSKWLSFLDHSERGPGMAAFREQWLSSALYLGHNLAFDTGGGIVQGSMVGISDTGELLLERNGVIVKVAAGHQVEHDSCD